MKKKLKIIIAIVICLVCAVSFIYRQSMMPTEGNIVIEDKFISETGDYYFSFLYNGTATLKCSKEEYDSLIIDGEAMYHIKFTYSLFFPTRYKLIYIGLAFE